MKNEMQNLSNDTVEPMEDAEGMKIVAENELLIHDPRVIVTPHIVSNAVTIGLSVPCGGGNFSSKSRS